MLTKAILFLNSISAYAVWGVCANAQTKPIKTTHAHGAWRHLLNVPARGGWDADGGGDAEARVCGAPRRHRVLRKDVHLGAAAVAVASNAAVVMHRRWLSSSCTPVLAGGRAAREAGARATTPFEHRRVTMAPLVG